LASHAGVVALIGLVALLARGSPSLDFGTFAAQPLSGATATLGFGLALVGFGVKAGFWPLHVWLPEAHPAAPSHVSALMSGVMIKLGIYGLLRFCDFLGPMRPSWALLVVAIGVVTALGGILHALAQSDLKSLLAYSSVENLGLITLGVGLGFVGRAHGDAVLAGLGFAGGLLHVLNHSLFKGLLFQAAGSVLSATGQREMDLQGGLLRRMPTTGGAFCVGSAAISGLPPLNGFVSELLIFLAAVRGASVLPVGGAVASLFAIATLALVGGLAAACFVKAFGIVFLGQPRTQLAAEAKESPLPMRAAMIAGATACVAIGLWPRGALALVMPVLADVERAAWLVALPALHGATRIAAALAALVLALLVVRRTLLARRRVTSGPTWGCGYSAPSPRMQYTGASFAAFVLAPFAGLIPIRAKRPNVSGYFPGEARYAERAGDAARERFFVPILLGLARALSLLRFVQRGRLQTYVLYIVLTLVALVVWQARGGAS
jgi:hydrogenase-4 component B